MTVFQAYLLNFRHFPHLTLPPLIHIVILLRVFAIHLKVPAQASAPFV